MVRTHKSYIEQLTRTIHAMEVQTQHLRDIRAALHNLNIVTGLPHMGTREKKINIAERVRLVMQQATAPLTADRVRELVCAGGDVESNATLRLRVSSAIHGGRIKGLYERVGTGWPVIYQKIPLVPVSQ